MHNHSAEWSLRGIFHRQELGGIHIGAMPREHKCIDKRTYVKMPTHIRDFANAPMFLQFVSKKKYQYKSERDIRKYRFQVGSQLFNRDLQLYPYSTFLNR